MSAQLEDEIDRLYAGPLDGFVSERNALSKRLKQSGAGEEADDVAGLRKPTLVAWTVNQLARENRRDVDLLLDAGKRIVDAQQASISQGERAGLDAAQASLRKAVADLTASARTMLGDRASQSTLTRVAETLRSAATEANGRELLARGRLTIELSDTGWDTLATLAPAEKRGRGKLARRDDQRSALKAAREVVRREQTARSAAMKELEKVLREETRLRNELEAASAEVEAARAEVAATEERLEDAQREVGGLTDS